mmetsp:Transcript_42049/g.47795  ORF Transcript_42049/g.47795 Transcript_42049/m.47795 type:complete len:156 (+) Transcript_42049:460-927(+)
MSSDEPDLDFGSKNGYETAPIGDGGQGQFGAVSPNDWRVPGTSPIGSTSFEGGSDGGDEPWFAEAVSTVSLDLGQAEKTMEAFTKSAAIFKMDSFIETKPEKLEDKEENMKELISVMGYDAFLESTPKQISKAWNKLKGIEDKKKKKAAKKPAKK